MVSSTPTVMSSTTSHQHATGGSFTDDITNIALFVQEKSAIDALKEMRRDGDGGEGEGNLEVVEINFVVNRTTSVPRPKTEQGFILVYEGRSKDRMFFCGTKTSKNRDTQWGDSNGFGNKERVTIFATEAQAVARRDALVRSTESYRQYNETKGPNYYQREDAEKNFKDEMKRREADVEAMKNLKIMPHIK